MNVSDKYLKVNKLKISQQIGKIDYENVKLFKQQILSCSNFAKIVISLQKFVEKSCSPYSVKCFANTNKNYKILSVFVSLVFRYIDFNSKEMIKCSGVFLKTNLIFTN